jgi:hypothetical protein
MKKATTAVGITLSLILFALFLTFGRNKATGLPGLNRESLSAPRSTEPTTPQNTDDEAPETPEVEDDTEAFTQDLLGRPSTAAPSNPEPSPSARAPISPEQFHSAADTFFSQMAAHSGQPDKSANGHDAAPYVLEAATMLRDLSEAVAENPALNSDALSLYRRCAMGSGYPSSVRALCYFQLKEMAPEQATEISGQLSHEIKELNDLL